MALGEQILATFHTIFEQFGWYGVVAIMIFENATSISPSEVILSLAGWQLLALSGKPAYFVFVTGLYTALGSTIGASILYWTARQGGRPLIEAGFRLLHLNPLVLRWAEVQFNQWGPGIVLIGRLIPGIRALISVPAGLVKMSYPKFLLYTLLGTYAYCTLFIGIGYTVGQEWPLILKSIQEYTPWFLLTVAFLAGIGLYLAVILRKRFLAHTLQLQAEPKEQ